MRTVSRRTKLIFPSFLSVSAYFSLSLLFLCLVHLVAAFSLVSVAFVLAERKKRRKSAEFSQATNEHSFRIPTGFIA